MQLVRSCAAAASRAASDGPIEAADSGAAPAVSAVLSYKELYRRTLGMKWPRALVPAALAWDDEMRADLTAVEGFLHSSYDTALALL